MSEGEVRDYRSLGEVLRGARESKGWTLEELSERSRIVVRMIKALEHDDFGEISSPVYARGFIRNLAGHLGLDPDWCLSKVDLRDASLAVPESVKQPARMAPEVPPTAPASPDRGPVWQVESVRVRKLEVGRKRSIPWGRVLVALALVGVTVLLMWAVPTWLQREPPAPDQVPVSARPIVAASDSSDIESTAQAIELSGPDDSPSTDESAADAATPRSSAPSPAPVPEPSNLEAMGPGSGGSSLPSVLSPDHDRLRPMTLVVRARERVEVTIAADGQPARQRVLRAGEIWTLGARDHFSVQVTDPRAIDVDLDGVKRTPPPGWAGDEWLLYPLPEGRGER